MKYGDDVTRYLVHESGCGPTEFAELAEAKAHILAMANAYPGSRFAIYAPICVAEAKIKAARLESISNRAEDE